MKLHVYLVAFLLTAALPALAQENAIEFGARAGIGISSLSRTVGHPDRRVEKPEGYAMSYFGAVFARLNMGAFALQPEVSFNAIAGKTTEEVLNGDIVFETYGKWKLNYLRVPVNLIYNIQAEGAKFYFGAGPYFAKALSGKFTPDDDTFAEGQFHQQYIDYYSIDAKFGDDNRSNFKSFDYGINALAGFEFANGILVNANYSRGLANAQTMRDQYSLYKSARITNIGISVGYKF